MQGAERYIPKVILLEQGLFLKIRAASNIGQKGHQNFTNPYSISFPSILHQKKALHNFQKKGQRPIPGCITGLDQGL